MAYKLIFYKTQQYITQINNQMENNGGQHEHQTKIQYLQDNTQQDEKEKISAYLPDANPIQKRQKLQPYSIFPLYSLPRFNFNSEIVEPTVTNETMNTVAEKLNMSSTSLKQIFKSPCYVFNQRAQTKSNADFGCLKVDYGQSSNYKMMRNVETIRQYLANNKRIEIYANFSQSQVLHNKIPFKEAAQQISENVQKPNQQIFFQSRFESGNLCFAALCQNSQDPTYNLILSRDMNTSKCTQWFFFKTINKSPGKVTFHILNFVKSYSVFSNGMKICLASKSNGYKWVRGGLDIKYRQTNIPIKSKRSEKCYYALSFSYYFTCPEDNVYFSYCYPYTYSYMEQFLFHRTESSPFLKRRNIAVTLGGNNVDLITISNFKQREIKKRIVFLTSRVHPGETPSSFICEGIMRFLLGESEEAQALRDNFVFKIVPMLNPDGVINGSYRCSLAGYDLNRVWHRADKISHPEIYGTRKAIFETNQKDKIFMFADLHAHSKKKGVFVYGCQDKNNPYLCRQLPFLFWKNVPDFNYHQCNFMMRTGRQGTSRLYIYRQLDIDLSYTIEHSFCGPSKQKIHYTAKDYMRIGVNYLLTFFKYFCRNKKIQFTEPETFEQLYKNKELVKVGDAQQLSSSDEQLDKQKAPLGVLQQKIQKKTFIKKETLRMSEGAIPVAKRTVSNFRKTNFQISDIIPKQPSSKMKQISEFGETMRPLPIVGPSFRQKKIQKLQQQYSMRPRICSTSLTNHLKPQNLEKKYFMRQTFRYEQQQQPGGLTNLFLPSLTRASYKKYSRKSSSPKNMIYIGNNLIQNALLLKEQIKSARKKKPNWKQQARSYL